MPPDLPSHMPMCVALTGQIYVKVRCDHGISLDKCWKHFVCCYTPLGNNFPIIPEYCRIYIPKYSQIFLSIFESFGIFCNILEYSSRKWNNNDLEYSIISWSILEYSILFQNIPEYSHWKVVLERYFMYFFVQLHFGMRTFAQSL